MMDIDTLFGPLPKSYCLYFYYLSIIGFVLLVLSVGGTLAMAVSKSRSAEFYTSSLMIAISYLIFYFQNRLLHTMCIHSI
jgi:hypothetical protein